MDVLFSDSPTRMSSSPLIAARKILNWSLCESDSDPGSSPAVGANGLRTPVQVHLVPLTVLLRTVAGTVRGRVV